jgi:hypothetical protein
MGTYSICLELMAEAENDAAAQELAEQIGKFVVHEGELADEYSVIDVEPLDEPDTDEQEEDE